MSDDMFVLKRNGDRELVSFDKILHRIQNIGSRDNINVGYSKLCMKVIEQLYDNIPTSKIDELMAQQCASMISEDIQYSKLASNLSISNVHKNTNKDILENAYMLYNFKDINNEASPLISLELFDIIKNNYNYLQSILDFNRDYLIDYFGIKTLERAYLMKINNKLVERPAHMWLRVAICIHKEDLDKVKETYDYMSKLYFTHATPTLFNAGTPKPQLSSCFLMSMKEDSIDGIYDTLKQCANISKWAGGIGLHIHQIRGTGTHIRGTNGTSNGIVPMLRNFNETARYVDQGGGKRNGSFAIYLSPWHNDIYEFLELKKNHGDENARARDLFYGLWIPDEFMRCIKEDLDWYLFCPDKCKGLDDVYSDAFVELYNKYVLENKYSKKVKARDLWFRILDSQMETGTPYLLYADQCNEKSNQKNLGTIKSSNLCTEIVEYSSPTETAVCNLASISLSKCVKFSSIKFNNLCLYTKEKCNWCKMIKLILKKNKLSYTEILLDQKEFYLFKEKYNVNTLPQIFDNDVLLGGFTDFLNKVRPIFDYELLHNITKIVARNLDLIIDRNYYPTKETKRSNFLHRPIGIGVQGLADVFALMEYPFDGIEAKQINKNIFETIYHAAIETSWELAKERRAAMIAMKDAIDNKKIFKFKNNNPDCRDISYMGENPPSIYLNLIEKYNPIYNEIYNLSENHLGAYSSFENSPTSKGLLQFDLWKCSPSDRYDWTMLKNNIMKDGIRNSLSVAPMPTASTSQILGNNECFEPFTSNIYTRRTLAGEFVILNKYLIQDLVNLDMWSKDIKNNIIANKGSVQGLLDLPQYLKDKYKVVWEMSMKSIIEMAADRGPYICQSMSMNLWVEDPNYKNLTAMHFYAWNKKLKTGIYYLRRKPKHNPQQFTIEPNKTNDDNKEDCLMCGS